MTSRTVRKLDDDSVIFTETFSYDAAGNVTNAPNSYFTYDTNNRLVVFNGNTVSYDLDGNMLSNGVQSFTYDWKNRLLTAGGHTYTYNAENVRIRNLCEDEDTTYTYDNNAKLNRLLCKTTNGVTTKYVYGRGLIGEEIGNAFKTYHFDSRGSTVAITDASGNVTDTFAYDTYGKLLSRTGTSKVIFGYNGRDGVVTDDNGLIYMRARYYSPEMKRFVNADIVAGAISNAITLNRYAYANGNPAAFIDPTGMKSYSSLNEVGFSPNERSSTSSTQAATQNRQSNSSGGWSISSAWNSLTNWVSDTANDIGDWAVDTYNTAKDAVVDTYHAIEGAVDSFVDFCDNVKEDVQNFDLANSDEGKVLESHYFSVYKGKLVLRPSKMGENAFSFGIIFLGPDVAKDDYNTVKHEYGHTVQYDKLGFWKYIEKVGIPSVTGYLMGDDLPYDYYTAPWEAEADKYGGVDPATRTYKKGPWTEKHGYYDAKDLRSALLN